MVLSSGATCETGLRGCSGEDSQEATGAQVVLTLFSPLVHGMQSANQAECRPDQDHKSPSASSDVQEAVADSVTTKPGSRNIQSVTTPTGLHRVH